MNLARRWRWITGLALVGATALVPAGARAQYAIDLPLGSTLPDLNVETLDGKPANLAAYIGKTPMVIEVWATWCENCEVLAPKMMASVEAGDGSEPATAYFPADKALTMAATSAPAIPFVSTPPSAVIETVPPTRRR